MKTFKNFQSYVPQTPLFPGVGNILHIKDEEGRDWYDLRDELSSDSLKIVYDAGDIIRSCALDASTMFPINMSVSEVDVGEAPAVENMCLGDWVYKDGKIIARLSDPVVRAEERRQVLLSEANSATSDWRTELQLGVIDDDDKASLIAWMAYIKALKSLDFSGLKNDEDYDAITWPLQP